MSSVCVDWKETQEAHVFTVEVPGLKKEEVHVIVSAEIEKCSQLQISGVRKIDEDNKYKWNLVERSRGYFDRKFNLPENAKAEEVSAAMEDGVLTVIVPKKDTVNEFHGGTIYDVFVH